MTTGCALDSSLRYSCHALEISIRRSKLGRARSRGSDRSPALCATALGMRSGSAFARSWRSGDDPTSVPGRQRASRTVARPATARAKSSTILVLPIPGGPIRSASDAWPAATRSKTDWSFPSSDSRPTRGNWPSGPWVTLFKRHAGTRPSPLSSCGPRSSKSAARFEAKYVVGPTRISLGSACAINRAAIFTHAPTAILWRSPTASRSTRASPVSMPTRILIGLGDVAAHRTLDSATRSARITSSECAAGAPNRMKTSSPMYFSIVPPASVAIALISRKLSERTRCIRSGPSRWPIPVDPTRSMKTHETRRRSDRRSISSRSPAEILRV